MLELKNDYSMTKTKNGLTEFEERKLITWIEYKNSFKGLEKLNNFGSKIRNKHDIKEDEKIIADYFCKGDKIQVILNKHLKDFDSYKDYIKTMIFSIALQNDIIRNIETYIKDSYEIYNSMIDTKKISNKLDREIKKDRKERGV